MAKATGFPQRVAKARAAVDRWLRLAGERCCVGRSQKRLSHENARSKH